MSSEHICFTAIPYDGFDSLLGSGGGTSSSRSESRWSRWWNNLSCNCDCGDWEWPSCNCCDWSISEEWKERLKLGAAVGGILAIGMGLGFAISAIVNAAKNHHHHHHHKTALELNNQFQLEPESPEWALNNVPSLVEMESESEHENDSEPSFWGLDQEHNHKNIHLHHQHTLQKGERPNRRHTDFKVSTNQKGFWKSNSAKPRLRKHNRPETLHYNRENQPQDYYEDFFPLEEEEDFEEQEEEEETQNDELIRDDEYDDITTTYMDKEEE